MTILGAPWWEEPVTCFPMPQPQTNLEQVRDFGLYTVCNPSETLKATSDDDLMEECSGTFASTSLDECCVVYPCAAVAITDKGKYLQDKHQCQIHRFVTVLCPTVINNILSEDMLCNDDFMVVAFPVAEAFLTYPGLCNSYTGRQKRQ